MSPSTSVIFSPEVDERQLDREVSQINQELEGVGQIDVQADGPELGTPEVGGGDGGGGLGATAAQTGILASMSGGIGNLSSKIPASVGAVTASAALPVAMAGAVGIGITKALGQTSARLGSVNDMFGTAMSLFFRPFGDFLGQILRPMAMGMLNFAADFNQIYNDQGLAVGLAWLGKGVASALGGSAVDLATGEGDLGDIALVSLFSGAGLTAAWLAGMLPSIGIGSVLSGMGGSALLSYLPSVGLGSVLTSMSATTLLRLLPIISIGAVLGGMAGGALGEKLGSENIGSVLGALTGGALAGLLGTVGISGILTAMSGGSLTGLLGSVGIGSVLTGLPGASALSGLLGSVGLGAIVSSVASVAVLIAGIASLGDLVDGDISSWNLPAKFGQALGEGFSRVWPNMAEAIHTAFTNNPIYDAGQFVGENALPEGGANTDIQQTGKFTSGAYTGDPEDLVDSGQTGGFISRGGLIRAHSGERLMPAGQISDRGRVEVETEGIGQEITQALEATNGGGDSKALADKLDDVNRNLKQLMRAFNVTLNVDGETLARTSENNRQEGLLDTDPTTG